MHLLLVRFGFHVVELLVLLVHVSQFFCVPFHQLFQLYFLAGGEFVEFLLVPLLQFFELGICAILQVCNLRLVLADELMSRGNGVQLGCAEREVVLLQELLARLGKLLLQRRDDDLGGWEGIGLCCGCCHFPSELRF